MYSYTGLLLVFVLTLLLVQLNGVSAVVKIPLKADDELQNPEREKLPGCYFDGHFYELEDTWHPDLGPPFGIMYCVKCECIALPRKGQITGKVRCRNFKHECPKPDCAEPVLLPNQCCKVCPNGNRSTTGRADTDDKLIPESPRTPEYLAILSSPTSRHVARGIFHFEPPGLHYSISFSPDFHPTSIVFQDEDGNALFTENIDESRIKNQKYCGVWDRIPRMYRRTLSKEIMQLAVTSLEDHKGTTKGTILLKRNQLDETFSALLLTTDPRKNGAAGIASISLGSDGTSVEFSVFLQGIHGARKDVRQTVKLVLEKTDERTTVRETTMAVTPKALEVSGRISDLSVQEVKWLARGKLSLRVSNSVDFDVIGVITAKPTCNLFQSVLYDISRPKAVNGPGSGVALFEMQPDGTFTYRVQVVGFAGRPSHFTIETNPKRGRRRIVDDITNSYSTGWANGTYVKQQPKDIQNLMSDELVLSLANENSGSRMQGQIKQLLYEEVHDRAFPNIISENPGASLMRDASGSAVAWLHLDENCIMNYAVFVDGYADPYVKKLQTTMIYTYDQHGTPVRKQAQLEGFKKFKSTGKVKNLKNDVLMGMPNGTIELVITANGETEPRLRGRVTVVDDCSSKHRFNGFVMEDPASVANTVVPTYTCQYRERMYDEGVSWKSEHKNCTMCSCQRGRILCEEMVCPEVKCRSPVVVQGECCPTCPTGIALSSVKPPVLSNTTGCYLDKKWHKPGAQWHPYLPPFGFTRCALCTCMPGTNTVSCTRITCPTLSCSEAETYRENPTDCCRRCPVEVSTTTVPPSNETLGDQAVFRPEELILERGGCRFQTEVHKNGAEWNPRVQPFGVMNCVLCRCKDGKATCKRQKCPKLTCLFIRKEADECCPTCTDQNDPKARPNRRLGRRKKQRRRRE